jgi:hypothetical protein
MHWTVFWGFAGLLRQKKVATCQSRSNILVDGFGRELALGYEGVQLLFHHEHLKQPANPMKNSLEVFRFWSYFFDRMAGMMEKLVFDEKSILLSRIPERDC